MKLRRGRKQPRNLYVQLHDQPGDEDVLVGQVDSPELSAFLIDAVCYYLERAERREQGAAQFTPTRNAFERAASALVNRTAAP